MTEHSSSDAPRGVRRGAPGRRRPGAARSAAAGRALAWGGFAVANLWSSLVGWLLVFVVVPALVLAWEPTVIVAGSMAPSIRAGDVVMIGDHDGVRLDEGTVITFEDHRGVMVTHRIDEVTEDGHYVTRGDANAVADSDPVAPGDVLGVGRLVVPLVGTPASWWVNGHRLAAMLIVVATGLAVAGSATPRQEAADETVVVRGRERRAHGRARTGSRRRWRWLAVPIAALVGAPLVLGAPSDATFSAVAANRGNAWRAADEYGAPAGSGGGAANAVLPATSYLGAPADDGPADLVLPLTASQPTTERLPNYSTDLGKKDPGRLLRRSKEPSFTNASEAVLWRSPPAGAATSLRGEVVLQVWARILQPPGPWTGHELVGRVHAFDPATGARRLLGTQSLHDDPFSPGEGWTRKRMAVAVDGAVRAGEQLEVHLQATRANRARDIHLAFGTADYPATLELPAPLP